MLSQTIKFFTLTLALCSLSSTINAGTRSSRRLQGLAPEQNTLPVEKKRRKGLPNPATSLTLENRSEEVITAATGTNFHPQPTPESLEENESTAAGCWTRCCRRVFTKN